ncbi:ankyrin repeat domain-containing protein [Sphingomonas naphthae]|uniref:Ankyrin repeat domain-containing protein n=1 Tax=Sphingomonas naphthae TaxID=1813468 RepID=A0ABY7TJ41_9SPHN|nr:ankyrin repeat domain-containing protein [Sphingomonas naphthae]WCT73247.1 ankyrin repeat domain-containing protein [Sphingomonas naphthae]
MGKRFAGAKARTALAALMLFAAAPPVAAQMMSEGYNFLKAVRERDANKAIPMLDKPGTGVVNTRDYSTGETGLIIATKGRDIPWMALMLQRKGKTELRDNNGDTPLTIAARLGFMEGAQLLVDNGAAVNLPTNGGETPLILATQKRDMAMVRYLLSAGGDPKIADRVTGKTAIDYARDDPRASIVLKMLTDAKPSAPVAGPARPMR